MSEDDSMGPDLGGLRLHLMRPSKAPEEMTEGEWLVEREGMVAAMFRALTGRDIPPELRVPPRS